MPSIPREAGRRPPIWCLRHERALALKARVLLDRTDDAREPLWVCADLAGHLFCVFVDRRSVRVRRAAFPVASAG